MEKEYKKIEKQLNNIAAYRKNNKWSKNDYDVT